MLFPHTQRGSKEYYAKDTTRHPAGSNKTFMRLAPLKARVSAPSSRLSQELHPPLFYNGTRIRSSNPCTYAVGARAVTGSQPLIFEVQLSTDAHSCSPQIWQKEKEAATKYPTETLAELEKPAEQRRVVRAPGKSYALKRDDLDKDSSDGSDSGEDDDASGTAPFSPPGTSKASRSSGREAKPVERYGAQVTKKQERSSGASPPLPKEKVKLAFPSHKEVEAKVQQLPAKCLVTLPTVADTFPPHVAFYLEIHAFAAQSGFSIFRRSSASSVRLRIPGTDQLDVPSREELEEEIGELIKNGAIPPPQIGHFLDTRRNLLLFLHAVATQSSFTLHVRSSSTSSLLKLRCTCHSAAGHSCEYEVRAKLSSLGGWEIYEMKGQHDHPVASPARFAQAKEDEREGELGATSVEVQRPGLRSSPSSPVAVATPFSARLPTGPAPPVANQQLLEMLKPPFHPRATSTFCHFLTLAGVKSLPDLAGLALLGKDTLHQFLDKLRNEGHLEQEDVRDCAKLLLEMAKQL
ncbi:hypothetical protein JCM11641_000691 [Rhodosporidiobolus odoratus]